MLESTTAALVSLLRTAQGAPLDPRRSGERTPSSARLDRDAALEELLARLWAPIFRFLQRRLTAWPDARELAEDLTQESLLRIARGVPSCRAASDRELLAWTLSTARRVLLNRLRAEEQVPHGHPHALVRAEVMHLTAAGDEEWSSSLSRSASAPRVMDLLTALLRSLTDEQAALIELYVWEERTWPEIGRKVGLSAGAAKMRTRRILSRLGTRIRGAAAREALSGHPVLAEALEGWIGSSSMTTTDEHEARSERRVSGL